MQQISVLYKWFDPVGSAVMSQTSLLGGSKKQGQYICFFFFFAERAIKEKQIILCELINCSAHKAKRCEPYAYCIASLSLSLFPF